MSSDFDRVLRDFEVAARTGREPEDIQRERHAAELRRAALRPGSVEYFADIIRETLTLVPPSLRLEAVDRCAGGILRSVISGPGTDAEVRAQFRNALDAGDAVRAELS